MPHSPQEILGFRTRFLYDSRIVTAFRFPCHAGQVLRQPLYPRTRSRSGSPGRLGLGVVLRSVLVRYLCRCERKSDPDRFSAVAPSLCTPVFDDARARNDEQKFDPAQGRNLLASMDKKIRKRYLDRPFSSGRLMAQPASLVLTGSKLRLDARVLA